jgi:hypothetical protein
VAGTSIASTLTVQNSHASTPLNKIEATARFFSSTTLSAQGCTWRGTYVHREETAEHWGIGPKERVRVGCTLTPTPVPVPLCRHAHPAL